MFWTVEAKTSAICFVVSQTVSSPTRTSTHLAIRRDEHGVVRRRQGFWGIHEAKRGPRGRCWQAMCLRRAHESCTGIESRYARSGEYRTDGYYRQITWMFWMMGPSGRHSLWHVPAMVSLTPTITLLPGHMIS